MYLKSLEMQGFKSFPDKIKLNFDKGLTAVVGPNGSGKSNIGDAVRWVLGEQSTKTLRGNKMEDVIFSGTALRKPVGFAKVTLNISNTSRKLAIESDEVSVTRKLFRSGESEYNINGRNVRLKDINELFMDTGLGRDGYSIIGQGRIAEIVGAKSNERRDIFEEASGISKFRYKKTEAEHKLAKAQDNILRLNDIVSELEARIEPLRIQSEKAKKFVDLVEKRKELEISIWVNQLQDLKEQINTITEKKLICTANYEKIEREITSQEEKIQVGYTKMQEASIKADEFQSKILETEKTASKYKSDIAVCENDILHSKNTITSLREQSKTEKKSQAELLEKIKFQEESLHKLNNAKQNIDDEIELLSKNLDNIQVQVQDMGKISEETGSFINSLYLKQSEHNSLLLSAKATLIEILSQIENIKKGSAEYKLQEESYKIEITELEKSIANISNREKIFSDRIAESSNKYQLLNGELIQKKQQFEKITLELKEKQQRAKFLSDLENNMDGFSRSVKEIIKATKRGTLAGIHGTVAQVIKVEQQYAAAIETVLGGALQNVIVNNEENAKTCISYLKNANAGRATFLPITSIKGNSLIQNGLESQAGFLGIAENLVATDIRYRGIVSSLLGRIVVCKDLDSATLIAKKYGYKFRIVTLDGQLINAGGSFTGGSISHSNGMLTRKNEIVSLDNKIKVLINSYNNLQESIKNIQSDYNLIIQNIEADKSEYAIITADKIRLQAEYKNKCTMAGQIKNQLENALSQSQQLEKRFETQKETESSAKKSLAIITEQIKSLEISIADEKGKKNILKEQRSEITESLSQKRFKQLELVKDLEALEREINLLNETNQLLKDKEEYYSLEILSQNRIISEKTALIDEYNELLENIHDNVNQYHSEIKKWQDKHNEYEANITEMRSELKNINSDKEQVSKEIARFEERKITFQKKIDEIILQMWENYEIIPTEAEVLAKPIENLIKVQTALNDLKAQIKNLGNVNVSAIEEYKEVSERYKFLSEQLKDVQKSKSELEKLISNLTIDMQEIFSKSFNQINENFQKIFVELFGGGNAELVLTEPENLLESGIEIIVAPPGKVIKNLISLSGGEQAFIAIAIYFAILKINPSPFCILDEIDAALDEVNVRKYSHYLKKFTHSTQFIMVTHRRGSMETANVLYGVTMQENGISKLLRLE